jgi:nucleotide-binding universal stress UspA family protein/CheY-like chemotaxis protein
MIVCVDDEPLANRALYRLLSREPYDVLVADNPGQALRYVRDYDVDLVITDQRMPDMTGIELLAEVKQVSPLTSGLILTAYPESVLVEDLPAKPAPPLFSKPWDDETLREGVRQVLRAKVQEIADPESLPGTAVKQPEAGPPWRKSPDLGVRTVLVSIDRAMETQYALGSILPFLKGDPLRIVVLEVLPELGLHRDVYAHLERMRSALSAEGIDAVTDVRWGDPAEQILLHARHSDADLIVLSNHGSDGWSEFLRGSVAERVLEGTEVPVLVGRPERTTRPLKRFLVPLDGSPESETAVPEAVRLAKRTGARLDLVGVSPRYLPMAFGYAPYALRISDRTPYLAEMARCIESQDIPADARFFEGDPAEEILQFARESGADLICMTAWRRPRWARYFSSSVAREILRNAPCPVLLRRVSSP